MRLTSIQLERAYQVWRFPPRGVARPVNTVVSLPQSDKRMLPLLQVSGETDAIDITLALTFCFVFGWRYHAVTLTSR